MALFTPQHSRNLVQYELNAFPPLQRRAVSASFGPDFMVKKDTLQRASNAVLTVDPDLVVPVIGPGADGFPYLVTLDLYITTAATPGFQFDFAGGTAQFSTFRGFSRFVTAAGAATTVIDVTATNTANNPAAAAFVSVTYRGIAICSASGTLGVRWAQSVSNATAAQVLVGSSLTVEPLLLMNAR